MERPTVVLVAHDVGGSGGMERHLEELVFRLKRDAYVIVVSCTLKLSDEEGIKFIRIPVVRRPFPIKYILFAIIASIRLLFVQYDILHTTGAIVFNRANISTVHFCHAGYMAATGGSRVKYSKSIFHRINSWVTTQISMFMERLIYRPSRTGNLVAVSNRVKSELLTSFPYPDTAVQTIPNGVDVTRFRPHTDIERRLLRRSKGFPDTGTFLLFMGGDWPLKGLEHVMRAFEAIAWNKEDVYLVVVGVGDIPQYTDIVTPSMRGRVHFVGAQSNPEDWFGLSDIFVFPSSYETFSLVVHEAAASGLVVLSTRVGGVEELIEDGVNGFFIARDVNDIARQLRPILTNLHEYQRTGFLIHDKVQSLTWDNMYHQFLKLYHQIFSTHRNGQRGWLNDYISTGSTHGENAP